MQHAIARVNNLNGFISHDSFKGLFRSVRYAIELKSESPGPLVEPQECRSVRQEGMLCRAAVDFEAIFDVVTDIPVLGDIEGLIA